MGKINQDFLFANTSIGQGKTYTRPERQLNIFDYLMSSAEERSQAPLVLQREGTPEQELVNRPKSWDNVKERKLERLMHEYTTHS